ATRRYVASSGRGSSGGGIDRDRSLWTTFSQLSACAPISARCAGSISMSPERMARSWQSMQYERTVSSARSAPPVLPPGSGKSKKKAYDARATTTAAVAPIARNLPRLPNDIRLPRDRAFRLWYLRVHAKCMSDAMLRTLRFVVIALIGGPIGAALGADPDLIDAVKTADLHAVRAEIEAGAD